MEEQTNKLSSSSSSSSSQPLQPTTSSSSSSSTTTTTTTTAEDKTKRLLSLARSKLEENQATIAAKDQQIQQLLLALEEERKNSYKKYHGRDDDHGQSNIRDILRRIDVDDIIWILVEYDSDDDTWVSFNSEEELKDFVARIPGAPINVPPRCLTSIESQKIENESKKREERIVEEFRRYKVRAEIARKQKDAETRQATLRSTSLTTSPNTSSPSLSASLEKALTDGALGEQNLDELQRMKKQIADQDTKWRQAYEKVVKENELLRTRGSEAILAAQWRERYEACIRERDDLSEKLKVYTKGSTNGNGGEEKSMEQAFIELKDEYKEFRRRVRALEQQRKDELEQIRLEAKINGNEQSFSRLEYDLDKNLKSSSSSINSSNNWERGIRPNMGESKLQYVRQMVCQYLSCRDSVVKVHIESALIAMFRFNEQERLGIELRQKEEQQDLTTSISSFLGSFSVT